MVKDNIRIVHPMMPLLSKIKQYRQMADEFRSALEKEPEEWGRYQSEFNQEVNGIFRDIMLYEKEKVIKKDLKAVEKLKQLFRGKLEKHFTYGELVTWSQKKPYGYAGDFKMMYDLYIDHPRTNGFGRLFDNYVQMSTIAVAVRNRKEDFKNLVRGYIKKKKKKPIKILSLACGPCQELKELISENSVDLTKVNFTCVDSDPKALKFSAERFEGDERFRFVEKNAIKMSFKKRIEDYFPEKYDFIYSTGLFDYLNERLSTGLIANLKKMLSSDGVLAVSDVQDKYSNSSFHFMELVGKWDLLYRDPDSFRKIFLKSGFKNKQLMFHYEQQGIMQYIVASNNGSKPECGF